MSEILSVATFSWRARYITCICCNLPARILLPSGVLCYRRYARSIFVSAAQKRKWQSTDELPVTSQPDHPTGIRKMSVLPAIATQ